ncbi:UDP-N-acetylmuramate--L-alanine ligase [bacterium]|nr:UDP-N-acetylmuramate--L-alanine ligase [bacterium]
MFLGIKNLHFIGIGGIGMSGLAEILHNLGFSVSGSDIQSSPITEHLSKLGIEVHLGHKKENIGENIEIIVYSSAINADNAEIIEAKNRGIPIIKRAEILAELMRIKDGIAIAGSHGKSSTTALCGKVLIDTQMDPTIIVGGRFDYIQGNAKLGKGKFLVAEADESDRSFMFLAPIIAIITSIDNDHLDNYDNSMVKLIEHFIRFINKVPFFGFSIICLDDENIQKIIPRIKSKYYTYGLKNNADYYAKNIVFQHGKTEYDVFYKDNKLGKFQIPYPGIHYVLNSLAVIALSHRLGLDLKKVKSSIKKYSGLSRRMEFMGHLNGAPVYNDYGHHPTEIKITLESFAKIKTGRLITIFQPHRYTRTKTLLEEFATSFYASDIAFIADIYPASEKPIKGINSELLLTKMQEHGYLNGTYLNKKKLRDELDKLNIDKNDIVLFLGAGNYYLKGYELLDENKE